MSTKTNPRLRHLRVKIKSLAAEARIIRHEERKALAYPPKDKYGTGYNHDYEALRVHRRGVVGVEARHSLLAYACLRGVPYKVVEPKVRIDCVIGQYLDGNLPDWTKVKEIAIRFGGKAEDVDGWIDEAQVYITSYAKGEVAA
jgi:hypothetical protein